MITKEDIITLLVKVRPDLDDNTALKFMDMYPEWKAGKSVKTGQRYRYGDKLYRVRQDFTTLEGQEPGIATAALYEAIDVTHAGTLEDPIPYDTTMTVYNGKYYIYGDVVYLCTRDSGQPLYAEPSTLIGNYFEVATLE